MDLKSRNSVFIATLGTEPQVITAALDLLSEAHEVVIEVVILHTTAPGTAIASAVQTLGQAFAEAPYSGRISCSLIPICNSSGRPLADLETPETVEAAFRALYRAVYRAKAGGQRVHLSIAGGRKTLAVYGMLAAQLLFEDGDCLWHLHSTGDFLASRRLHPRVGDDTHLVPIPVVQWARVSPALLDLGEDPYRAIERQQKLRLDERLKDQRIFVRKKLTPAEEKAVALLVSEGLGDAEIAGRLVISARTVENQLRSAYSKAADYWELASVSRAGLVHLLSLYYTYAGEGGER